MNSPEIPEDPDTLSLEEAARRAKCGVECMRELVRSGEVPAASFHPKHVVLVRDQFLQWLRERAARQAQARREQRKREAEASEWLREHAAQEAAPERNESGVRRAKARPKRGRAGAVPLPDLTAYEITTAAPPALNRGGSRNA